jgi:cytochrome P450
MLQLSLTIAASALLGIDLQKHTEKIKLSLEHCMRYVYGRMESMIAFPDWIPSPQRKLFRFHLGSLNKVIYDIIDQKQQIGSQTDLLDLIIASTEYNESDYHKEFLRDDIMTLFLAGFETTATTLTWALFQLARYPQMQKKIFEEVHTITESDLKTGAYISKATYLSAFINEILRFYPPVWSFSRQSNTPTEINGYTINKNDFLVLCPYSMHRHSALWQEPDKFDPDRFIDNKIPPFQFIPFGAGIRQCMGSHFAYMEITMFIIQLCKKFILVQMDNQSIEFRPGITLRTKQPLYIQISPRH